MVIEAVDPIKIDPTSMSNPCKVFDNLHMQWMCIWMRPYNITAPHLHQAFGSHLEFWVTAINDGKVCLQRGPTTSNNKLPTFQHFTFNDQDATHAHSSDGFFKSKSTGVVSPPQIELSTRAEQGPFAPTSRSQTLRYLKGINNLRLPLSKLII